MSSSKYYNWVNPSQFFQRPNNQGTSSFDQALLPSASSCHVGSYYTGTECIIAKRFLCFSTTHSQTSLTLPSSSLDPRNHSVLLWFSIHSHPSMTGSVDLKFVEQGFHILLSPVG